MTSTLFEGGVDLYFPKELVESTVLCHNYFYFFINSTTINLVVLIAIWLNFHLRLLLFILQRINNRTTKINGGRVPIDGKPYLSSKMLLLFCEEVRGISQCN